MADYLDLAELALRLIEKNMAKPTKRQRFSKVTHKKILANQNYKCALCQNKLDVTDFDHIDGNSSNNRLDNCQDVCPNCHAKKTRKNKKRKMEMSQMLRKIKKYLR